MRIEELTKNRVEDFVEYCKRHRTELDDSFLYDQDLIDFEPNDENPTYIIINQQEEVVGVASLIMSDYYRRGKKARFRIFHTELDDLKGYDMLMKNILRNTKGLDQVYVFVPVVNKKLVEFIVGLKFTVERHSFLLIREDREVPDFTFPNDYLLKSFRIGLDEKIWCEVRNASFAKLQGSETPITPEMVRKMMSEEDYLEGGAMILYHQEKPIGIIRCADDDYENAPIMNIGPIALLPEYQGLGLGRNLLRASLHFAKEKGYSKSVLCVNADNEKAKALYLQEGFIQVEAVTCYIYDLKK